MRRRLLMVGTIVVAGIIIFLLSVQQQQSTEASLEGKVLLNGQPFGGATIDFHTEEKLSTPTTGKQAHPGPIISRYSSRAHSDADGRYSITLRPNLLYQIAVRDPSRDKTPLPAADGKPLAVPVGSGKQHFDIQLATP
jgi:hypothetical protein